MNYSLSFYEFDVSNLSIFSFYHDLMSIIKPEFEMDALFWFITCSSLGDPRLPILSPSFLMLNRWIFCEGLYAFSIPKKQYFHAPFSCHLHFFWNSNFEGRTMSKMEVIHCYNSNNQPKTWLRQELLQAYYP